MWEHKGNSYTQDTYTLRRATFMCFQDLPVLIHLRPPPCSNTPPSVSNATSTTYSLRTQLTDAYSNIERCLNSVVEFGIAVNPASPSPGKLEYYYPTVTCSIHVGTW